MVDAETLLELERRLWNADEAVYENVLAANAVMVFPEPTGVLDRAAVLESLGDGDRWSSLDVSDVRSLSVDDDVTQVVYEAVAERSADGSEYRALVTSTYHRQDGEWRLVSHQQTPVSS